MSLYKFLNNQFLFVGWLCDLGFRYIHALGEIYRVAEIIGASVKLHRPWILSNSVDTVSFFALLNECYSAWSDSGLEEALIHISNESNLKQDGILRELIESIKYIHELDEHALQTFVITGEETTCRLSALPAGFMPGMYSNLGCLQATNDEI